MEKGCLSVVREVGGWEEGGGGGEEQYFSKRRDVVCEAASYLLHRFFLGKGNGGDLKCSRDSLLVSLRL